MLMDEVDDRGPANACVSGEVPSGERGTGLETNATVDFEPATKVACLEVLAVVFVAVTISNVGISCLGGGGGGTFDEEVEARGGLVRLLVPGSRGSPSEERDSSLKFGSVESIFQLKTALGGRTGVAGDNVDTLAFSSNLSPPSACFCFDPPASRSLRSVPCH